MGSALDAAIAAAMHPGLAAQQLVELAACTFVALNVVIDGLHTGVLAALVAHRRSVICSGLWCSCRRL